MIAQQEPLLVPRVWRISLFALVGLMLVLCWTPRLRWGLWLDETFTAWQVDGGLAAILGSKLDNPGQSVLFAYIEWLFYFPQSRSMEFLLRIPSVLGALLSCFFVYRLGESFVRKGAGLIALIPFAANRDVIQFACEARPYTLATAACLGCLWGLLQWLESGEMRYALLFSVLLALIPYLHLIYAVFFVVPAYVLITFALKGKQINFRVLLQTLGLTVLLLLPLIPFLLDFQSRSQGLSYLPTPGLNRLLYISIPLGPALLSAIGLLFLLSEFGVESLRSDHRRTALTTGVFWLLVCPLLLFVVSRITHQTILIERYLLHTVAAQSLIIAFLFSSFQLRPATLCLLICFVPVTTAFGVKNFFEVDGAYSWRLPFRILREMDPSGVSPLLVQSGHPISNRLDWQHAPERGSFLYSQIFAYPVPNLVYPLPYNPDEAANLYVKSLVQDKLVESEMIFYAGKANLPMSDWVRRFFEARGYVSTYAHQGELCLIAFHRQHSPATRERDR